MINCTFEDGAQASLRHVVVDVLVLRGDEILLIKRTGKLLEGGKWALPGGFVGRDETAAQAAAREAREETGWSIEALQLMLVNSRPDRPHEDRQNVSLVFTATAVKQVGEHDWETDDVKWFSLDQLPDPSTLAFDHGDYLKFYLKHRSGKPSLPVLL